MRKFSENCFLADLYRKDSVQAVFLQSLVDSINNIAKGAGVAVSGDLPAPPPVNAINVKASGEMLHVTLTHAAELTRAIDYHIEADTNPNFTAPQIVSQGSRRTHIFNLPGFTDSGVSQPWYIRAYAQYRGSKPSQPLVFGGLANPTPIILTGGAGGTRLTPLGSTGSGTASTTGQQRGQGHGKYRVSTPKVIRVGKQQAAVQATQTIVQPGGPPVIIFNPTPPGTPPGRPPRPPMVVVDQSGNAGIDFAGGTPIFQRLSANGVAFADLSGNLLLKNISQASNSGGSVAPTLAAQVPNLTTTVTTHGNTLLIIGNINVSVVASTIATLSVYIYRDGASLGLPVSQVGGVSFATSMDLVVPIFYLDSPTAASHTYAIYWAATSANTWQTSANFSTIQLVELG